MQLNTSQACYGHHRCNLNIVRLVRFSLPLSVFGRLFLFLHLCCYNPTALSMYCAVPNPRVKCGGAPVSPVMPNSQRSAATQSVYSFSFPPCPHIPAFSNSPDMALLGNLWSPMRSSALDHSNLLVHTIVLTLSHSIRWRVARGGEKQVGGEASYMSELLLIKSSSTTTGSTRQTSGKRH